MYIDGKIVTKWGKFYPTADGICQVLNEEGGIGYWDYFLVRIYEAYVNKESVVLDIGAHFGSQTVYLSQLAKMVYAFEPNLYSYNWLIKNLELNECKNVIAKNLAISNRSGRRYEVANPPDNYETYRYTAGLSLKETDSGSIDSVCIDDLNLERLDFFKCDAQGMDIEIIRGGIETIQKFRPVFTFEVDDRFQKFEIDYICKTINYSLEALSPNDFCARPL